MKKLPACIRCIPFFKRALIFLILLSVGFCPLAANAFEILLGTGETGTFSHFSGRLLSRIINKNADGILCKALPAPDDVHNLTNLQGGSLDIILIDSMMLQDAMGKKGAFEFLDISYDNLRILFPVYDVPVTLVVRQDAKISSLDDLEGKRINAGAPRSAQHLAMDTIIQAKGWTPDRFSLIAELPSSLSQDTMAFCHGTVQAMVNLGVHPDSSLQQLFKLCEAVLISMDDADIEKLINGNPAFSKIAIPAETYPAQTHAVTTFGTRMILVASENLDKETTYKLIQTIDRHQKNLQGAHPALSLFTFKAAPDPEIGIPLHPGAAKFFSEQ
jgi:TRAP transporter TAXI family solute receptor